MSLASVVHLARPFPCGWPLHLALRSPATYIQRASSGFLLKGQKSKGDGPETAPKIQQKALSVSLRTELPLTSSHRRQNLTNQIMYFVIYCKPCVVISPIFSTFQVAKIHVVKQQRGPQFAVFSQVWDYLQFCLQKTKWCKYVKYCNYIC